MTPEDRDAYAQQILELASRSKEHMAEMTHGLQGTVDIASVEGHAPRLLAKWIADFSVIHPHIQYSIWDGSTDDVIYRVANGLADFGILTTPYNAELYETVPVYEEPWTAMIPSGDPLAALPGDTIPLHLLQEKNLIIPSRRSRLDEIQNWFPDPDRPLHIICRVAHMLNAYELARNGVGIAIYPASDNHFSDDPSVVIKRITEPEVTVTYLLVWDKERRLSHAAQQFLAHAREMRNSLRS